MRGLTAALAGASARCEGTLARALLVAGVIMGVMGCSITAQSAVHIEGEALVELPSSALWTGIVNFRPGDEETVGLNPPRFAWSYTPDPADANSDIEEKMFLFQVGYDADLANPCVNVRTRSNMYNFLAPFVQTTCYWRVGYIHEGETDPYAYSAVRTFSVADNAEDWDRSSLTNETYMAQKGQHPHMLFNSSNRQAFSDYLEANGGAAWASIKQQADEAVASWWWTVDNPTLPDPDDPEQNVLYQGSWALRIAKVAFVWQMTRDQALLDAGPQEALVRLSRWYLDSGGWHADIVGSVDKAVIRTLGFGYDWLYEVMTPGQRQEVLAAIEANCKYIENVAWWRRPKDASLNNGDPTGVYAGGFWVTRGAASKIGSSHSFANHIATMVAALAAYPENDAARELLDLSMNYMIGKTYPFGSEDGLNQGRPYSLHAIFYQYKHLYNAILCDTTFPEAGFNRNPFWHKIADWAGRITPVGFVQGHEPWGDTGWGEVSSWRLDTFGKDLAYFINDGATLQQWQEQKSLATGNEPLDGIEDLAVPFHFSEPTAEDRTDGARAFYREGWAMASTYPSNTKECFADGVGFVFQARPRGSEGGHSHYSDLSFQLWAYGSTITDAGAQMSAYAKIPLCHYSLLVDGLGTAQPMRGQNRPCFSRIFAFKDSPDYTYVAADGTAAYPQVDFTPGDWLRPATWGQLHGGGPLAYVTKVRRHILFVRKKYFVVFDELESEQPATFTWLYHILEDTLDLSTANSSFRYTSNTIKYTSDDPESVTVPDVPVHVSHIANRQDLEWLDLTGDQVRSNPITGEDYLNDGDSHHRAHALWVSNKTPTNKFHFMTVIYPVKPGTAEQALSIQRRDDYTVEVECEGESDIVSFNAETADGHGATLVVDLQAMGPIPIPADDIATDYEELAVSVSGTGSGEVSASKGLLSIPLSTGTESAYYASGAYLSLYAAPATGSVFSGWSGDCSGDSSPVTIAMNGAKAVTAIFTAVGNQPPQAEAGLDQVIALSITNAAILEGTFTDDGLPEGADVALEWSQMDGPGPVLFDDATRGDTAARFSDAGLYTLKLNATDGEFTGDDSMQVLVRLEPDTTPPSVPSGLQSVSVTASSVGLGWNASSDATGVTGYRVYRDAVMAGEVTETTFVDTGLSPLTTYDYSVSARDLAGNESSASPVLSVSTGESVPVYSVTVQNEPGTGGYTVLSPAGGTYEEGSVVTITAVPGDGYTFAGWSDGATGSVNPITITVNADISITASFDEESANTPYEPREGPVLWMPFEGDYADQSGCGNHAAAVNPPTFVAAGGADGSGCYEFDGIDDRLFISDADLSHDFPCKNGSTNGLLTIALWVNAEQYRGDLVCKWSGSLALWLPSNGSIKEHVSNTVSAQLLPTNTWQHIAMTSDGSHTRIYLMGQQVAQQAHAGFSPSGSSFTVGNTSDRFKGRIDDLRVYNRALSAAEIQSIVAGSSRPLPPQNLRLVP